MVYKWKASADVSDHGTANAIEFECRGPTRREGVGADTGWAVPRVEQTGVYHTLSDGACDVRSGDMAGVWHIADWEASVKGRNSMERVDPVGQCFDRAKVVWRCSVVHCTASLAVLLIVNVQSDRVGLAKGSERHRVRDN